MCADIAVLNDEAEDRGVLFEEIPSESSEIEFSTEDITPDVAETMLRTARTPYADETAITTYALSMSNDAWMENGQTIVFDEDGRLVDGVQRLNAVIRSGKTIRSLVARNVRGDTLHTIDQHRRRNYAGVLESRGIENAGAVVRLMGRMIRIENGVLNRDPISISWSRYNRVLDSNPDIIDAVRMSEKWSGNELHNTPRSVLAFEALRAGHAEKLQSFLEVLDPSFEGNELTAALQFRMMISSWNNDVTTRQDPDKVLGNAITYFNAWLKGELLAPGYVWNFERGRVRDSVGKWVPADRAIRNDRAEGLRVEEHALLMSGAELDDRKLERIARKMLLENPKKGDRDDALPRSFYKMSTEKLQEFLENRKTLRERLRKEAERRLVEEASPPNLGMPVVDGYKGLSGAKIDRSQKIDVEAGVLPELSVKKTKGKGKSDQPVSARMVTITPEQAKFWLSPEINRSNRKVMMRHVTDISRDIANDRWMLNAQPIAFTKDPFGSDTSGLRLLNGQHRLHAVEKAGMEIEVPIAVNVDEGAFATFDSHAKKTVRTRDDSRPVDDRVMMAAARLQWREDEGIALYGVGPSPTASEFMDTLDRHPKMADYFARSRRRGMTEMGSAGVMTYFMYRVNRDDPQIAPDFLDDLETGENLTVENPVHKIRQEILRGRQKMSRKEILSRLLETWDDYQKWRNGSVKTRAKSKAASAKARAKVAVSKNDETDQASGDEHQTSMDI